jgi:hypothetical protein
MVDPGSKAYEAHIAATILALGIQKINSLSQGQIDKVYDYALDSLYRAGINIDFSEIKNINALPINEAQSTVIRIKSNIVAALHGSSSALASQLFELTFNIYLVSTTPEEFVTVRDYLKQLAFQTGFINDDFLRILEALSTDIEVGLPEYENAVKKLIKAEGIGSILDVFEMKPGLVGFNFDIKMAIDKYQKWRGA